MREDIDWQELQQRRYQKTFFFFLRLLLRSCPWPQSDRLFLDHSNVKYSWWIFLGHHNMHLVIPRIAIPYISLSLSRGRYDKTFAGEDSDKLGIFHANQTSMCLDQHLN